MILNIDAIAFLTLAFLPILGVGTFFLVAYVIVKLIDRQ